MCFVVESSVVSSSNAIYSITPHNPIHTLINHRVRHLKALVEDDHELHDLVSENDEFGWCVPLPILPSPSRSLKSIPTSHLSPPLPFHNLTNKPQVRDQPGRPGRGRGAGAGRGRRDQPGLRQPALHPHGVFAAADGHDQVHGQQEEALRKERRGGCWLAFGC